ncbi:hypothetical protein CH252_20725 [Rhodococcus sp. 06-1477-1B]|nr:hypothetical protein CH252_20725 [Rhodococcus sp. 06-1477-1B]
MTLPAGIRVAWCEVPVGAERRATSRAVLADLLPGARFASRCPSCGGDHGRVHVEGADAVVSVSYVEGWAVGAAASGYERIGVDAVRHDAGDLERVLSGAADARAWARVEAVLKADGRGLAVDPARVDVREAASGWEARIDGGAPYRGWDLAGPAGVVLALAVL